MHKFMSRRRVEVASQPEDDIDKLFNYLGQLEPPDELVARILTHIGHLPKPSACPPSVWPPVSGDECEKLLVHNEWRDPS